MRVVDRNPMLDRALDLRGVLDSFQAIAVARMDVPVISMDVNASHEACAI